MKILFDPSLSLQSNLTKHGVQLSEAIHQSHADAYNTVTTKLLKEDYQFAQIIQENQIRKKVAAMYKKYHNMKTLIVLGIGGSDLGARMLKQALQPDKPKHSVLFAANSTDPDQYKRLFTQFNPKETVVNVVSKSGSTTETASGYLLLKAWFKKALPDSWHTHFVFTTSKDGLLYQESQTHNIAYLEHEPVGGRFAVLSSVGLFPALFMQIDSNVLVEAAKQVHKQLTTGSQQSNIAWNIALLQYQFATQHAIDTVVLMPYIDRLELFANWFRQLWAESLGKNATGVLPIKAQGPADQHSQLQFYAQGKWLSSFLFINAKHYASDIVIDNHDVPSLAYLHATPLEDIIKFECEATRYSLASDNRPSALLTINTLNTQHMGALIYIFEAAVTYLAQLFSVNAFDQPGVEQSKRFLHGLLGKPENHKDVEQLNRLKQTYTQQNTLQIHT